MQVQVNKTSFAELVAWLQFHRPPAISVLIHPLTRTTGVALHRHYCLPSGPEPDYYGCIPACSLCLRLASNSLHKLESCLADPLVYILIQHDAALDKCWQTFRFKQCTAALRRFASFPLYAARCLSDTLLHQLRSIASLTSSD